jgi:hypothetical protein
MRRATILALTVLMTFSIAAARSGPGGGNGPGSGDGSGSGPGYGGHGNCGGLLILVPELPFEDVSAAEEADLVFMREEEKLARDVYQAMDDLWGLRAFGQINWSEQSHMDAVRAVLDKYGIPDPVGDNPPGEFTDAGLQQLFDQLLDQGSLSLIDALIVGATIEDLDIHDLDGALDRADNVDIRTVYQNLQKGSRNHLRAFYGLLVASDATYDPQYLSLEDFEEIVNSPMERGMVDADGEPAYCSGGSRPGPGHLRKHRHQHGMWHGEPLRPFE